jgi:hypothetical protein
VTTFPVTSSTTIHIDAAYDGITRSAELTVLP